MEHKQKVTNINHAKFDIHTLDNLEVTRTFMFNLHIQTILAKIMWDKLAECTASTIDQFFTSKQAFFGPNPTFLPLPPCNVVRKERLADESSNFASGGWGSERILQQFGKKALCPTHFGHDCRYIYKSGVALDLHLRVLPDLLKRWTFIVVIIVY